jgi:hypothetical protein
MFIIQRKTDCGIMYEEYAMIMIIKFFFVYFSTKQIELDATEVGAVVKSTRARSGGRIQVTSPFYFAVNSKCYVNNEGLEIDC